MQADLSQITSLVVDLLKESSPEYAARLKQRLNIALLAAGFDRFDENSFGSKRFKDFLHKHFSEQLSLVPPIGQGDILVSLRKSPPVTQAKVVTDSSHATKSLEKPVVRPDVWQAFVNQDKERFRFLRKVDGKVVHYRNGEPADVKAVVEAAPGDYAEICPISEDIQLNWFKSFLEKNPPNARIAEAIGTLLDAKVGGPVIDGISHMLGSNGATWRVQRTRLIYEHIAKWCIERNIDPSIISNPSKNQPAQVTASELSNAESATSVRKQAHAILESLSDNDIAQIVLPILVSTVLVKARV